VKNGEGRRGKGIDPAALAGLWRETIAAISGTVPGVEALVPAAAVVIEFLEEGWKGPPAPSLVSRLLSCLRDIAADGLSVSLLSSTLVHVLAEDGFGPGAAALGAAVLQLWQREENAAMRGRAREARRQFVHERRRYLTLFRSLADAAFVMDSSRRIVDCNQAFCDLFSMARSSVIGRECRELLGSGLCERCPCCTSGGNPAPFHNIEACLGPEKIRAADGTPRRFVMSGAGLPLDEHGGAVVVLLQDVTEKKQAEDAVARSERKYRSLIENLPAVTWRGLADGSLVYISPNAEKLFGVPAGELAGKDRFDLVHPDDREWVCETYRRLFGQGVPFDLRYRIKTARGWRWVHDRASRVCEDEDGPVADGVMWDISELKEIEEELEEYRDWLEDMVDERTEELVRANERLRDEVRRRRRMARELVELTESLKRSNEELERFAHAVSHDLKEPLVLICAFAAKLKKGYFDRLDDRGRDFLDRIIRAGSKLQHFIDGLFALARVASRGGEFEEVELATVIGEVVGDLSGLIEKHGGRVEIAVEHRLVGDRLQLYQLFQNILSNAIKYHREGVAPMVRVESELLDDRMCEIRVTDNGVGFDEAELSRIFLPFVRLSASGNGAGIGLSTCERIVERHGGEITAQSVPGRGTTFIVRLPAAGRRR